MDGRILFVDDVATNRIVFKVKLGAACYQPILAADGASCLRLARDERPDLILLDLMLPDMSGLEVLRRLRGDPGTRDIPVVVFSATSDPEAALAVLEAGADDFLTKPIDDQLLLARLRSLLRARDGVAGVGSAGGPGGAVHDVLGMAEPAADFARPGVIALVTGRPETALRLRRDLGPVLRDRIVVLSREEALADGRLHSGPAGPDVYIVDSDLGGPGGGLRLLSDLRSRQASRHAAICVLRQNMPADQVVTAYDLGANDVVRADITAAELALRLRGMLRRKQGADRLRASVQDGLRMAVLDPLTGLHNRRYAMPHLAAIAERAAATAAPFAVMVVDIDRFKQVNDCWGHAAGDFVLVEVARRLTANLRASDLLARIGGEEFLIALPDSTLADARVVAERLCHVIEEHPIALPDAGAVRVTVSIGLAVSGQVPDGGVTPEPVPALLNRADRALLHAKSAGRNQVTISLSAA